MRNLLVRRLRARLSRARPYATRERHVDQPVLIINLRSGDGEAERLDLQRIAEETGVQTVVLEPETDLAMLTRRIVDAGADAVGMAGGDGSLGLVAGVAVEQHVPFFCVPLGVRSRFARDLGLDLGDRLAALDAVRHGEELLVDCCLAGGSPFVDNLTLGVFAAAAHANEGAAQADPARRFSLRYTTSDGVRHEQASLIVISNNRPHYGGLPDLGRRMRMDAGKLGLGAVTSPSEGQSWESPLSSLRWREWDASPRYRIDSDERILATRDGEPVTFEPPLDITIRRKALAVLVPAGTRPGYVPSRQTAATRLVDLAGLAGMRD